MAVSLTRKEYCFEKKYYPSSYRSLYGVHYVHTNRCRYSVTCSWDTTSKCCTYSIALCRAVWHNIKSYTFAWTLPYPVTGPFSSCPRSAHPVGKNSPGSRQPDWTSVNWRGLLSLASGTIKTYKAAHSVQHDYSSSLASKVNGVNIFSGSKAPAHISGIQWSPERLSTARNCSQRFQEEGIKLPMDIAQHYIRIHTISGRMLFGVLCLPEIGWVHGGIEQAWPRDIAINSHVDPVTDENWQSWHWPIHQ